MYWKCPSSDRCRTPRPQPSVYPPMSAELRMQASLLQPWATPLSQPSKQSYFISPNPLISPSLNFTGCWALNEMNVSTQKVSSRYMLVIYYYHPGFKMSRENCSFPPYVDLLGLTSHLLDITRTKLGGTYLSREPEHSENLIRISIPQFHHL